MLFQRPFPCSAVCSEASEHRQTSQAYVQGWPFTSSPLEIVQASPSTLTLTGPWALQIIRLTPVMCCVSMVVWCTDTCCGVFHLDLIYCYIRRLQGQTGDLLLYECVCAGCAFNSCSCAQQRGHVYGQEIWSPTRGPIISTSDTT